MIVLLPVLSLLALAVVELLTSAGYTDLHVYRAEGVALRDGLDLYGPLPGVHGLTTYPPFAAIVFVPTTLLPIGLLELLALAANLALALVVSWQSVRRVRGGRPGAFAAACVLAAVVVWTEPVTASINYGQVNLALLALVLWDFNLPDDSRLRGVGVGLAAGLKVTSGLLIVYLVLTGRFRAAGTAVATFLASVGIAALVAPGATWSYWTGHLFDLERAGRLENSLNQSVRGWLVRAEHTRDTGTLEQVLVALVLVAGLACAVLAYRRLGDSWGLPAAAITGLLISPITWSHHWVWCIPVVALLWYEARPFVVPALLVFGSYAVWAVPHGGEVELSLTGLQVASSGWYVVLGLTFLALTTARSLESRSHQLQRLGGEGAQSGDVVRAGHLGPDTQRAEDGPGDDLGADGGRERAVAALGEDRA